MSVELEDTRAGIQWQKHSEYKVNKTSFFQCIDWGQNSIWIKNQSGCLPWRSKLREDGIFLTVIPFYALSLHTGELKFLRALELHHKNPLKSFTHLYSFYRRQLPLCWTFLELFWGNLSKQWLVTLSLLWPCIEKRLFAGEGIAGGVAAQNRAGKHLTGVLWGQTAMLLDLHTVEMLTGWNNWHDDSQSVSSHLAFSSHWAFQPPLALAQGRISPSLTLPRESDPS